MITETSIQTSKKQELIDISNEIKTAVAESGTKNGICTVYTPHATAAIIINENYDPNICLDTIDALNKLIPTGKWRHDRVDGNGAAHIQASILGPSETIIIKDGNLLLGTWQSPMLAELDGPRNRKILISMMEK